MKPPPLKSKWLQMRPAIVLDRPPASVSSSIGGNGLLYRASRSPQELRRARRRPSRARAARRRPMRRTYGQRSRIRLARVNSPVRVLPMITPVLRARQPLAVGEAGVGQRPGRGVERQPVGQVGGPVGAAGDLDNRTRSNSKPSITAALRRVEPVGCGRVGRPVVRQAHPLVRAAAGRRGARRARSPTAPRDCRRPGIGRPCRRWRSPGSRGHRPCSRDGLWLGHGATAPAEFRCCRRLRPKCGDPPAEAAARRRRSRWRRTGCRRR